MVRQWAYGQLTVSLMGYASSADAMQVSIAVLSLLFFGHIGHSNPMGIAILARQRVRLEYV